MDGQLESTTSFSVILSGTIGINEKKIMDICRVFNEATFHLNMKINWVGYFCTVWAKPYRRTRK